MFEYFPGNYIWNLGVVATLNSGGTIDEVDRACRPIRELATQGSDVGTAEFMAAWQRVADQLEEQAAEAEKAGHVRTAGQKYLRAAVYVCQAERMQSASAPGRNAIYQHCLDLMQKSFDLVDPATTRVAIPFERSELPASPRPQAGDGVRLRRWLLSSMIVASTMTTGWHYFVDVLGGLFIAVIALMAASGMAESRARLGSNYVERLARREARAAAPAQLAASVGAKAA